MTLLKRLSTTPTQWGACHTEHLPVDTYNFYMAAGTASLCRVTGAVAGRYKKRVSIFSRGKSIFCSPKRQYRLFYVHTASHSKSTMELKRSWPEADHSIPSRAEVKNSCSYTCTSPLYIYSTVLTSTKEKLDLLPFQVRPTYYLQRHYRQREPITI
jgi:hypothetical protein